MKSTKPFQVELTVVALVDVSGRVVGRAHDTLMRGDDLTKQLPGLKATLDKGTSAEEVWNQGSDSWLATYVAAHDGQGKIIGALVVARALYR
jgi:hypothetical protein